MMSNLLIIGFSSYLFPPNLMSYLLAAIMIGVPLVCFGSEQLFDRI